MVTRPAFTLVLMALLSTVSWGASPVVKSTRSWSGKVGTRGLEKLAPVSGCIAAAETWKKLWTAWRPGEGLPHVDFGRELVLVGTVAGPNRVMMRPTISKTGEVNFIVAGTKMAGPGFGYQLMVIPRNDVKTVNGTALAEGQAGFEDSITVTVVGTLRSGIMAIGGETTGVTITAQGITWELQWDNDLNDRPSMQRWHGKRVIVRGSLESRRGVELKERRIVTVTELKAVNEAGRGEDAKPRLAATVERSDARLRFSWESTTAIIDVVSPSGIDSARIQRMSSTWPESVVVRLHLKGLESMQAISGKTVVQWSVSSSDAQTQRVSLRQGGQEVVLQPTSPYHSALRIVGPDRTLPIQGGYFEIPLPAKLFEGNPTQIKLSWIDFYRN